jgi:hypothetical protein
MKNESVALDNLVLSLPTQVQPSSEFLQQVFVNAKMSKRSYLYLRQHTIYSQST